MDNVKDICVRTLRYRYQKEWTGKQPSYTEWELYINNELIATKERGNKITNVNKFIEWVREKYSIDTHIEKLKPETINLQFKAQRI